MSVMASLPPGEGRAALSGLVALRAEREGPPIGKLPSTITRSCGMRLQGAAGPLIAACDTSPCVGAAASSVTFASAIAVAVKGPAKRGEGSRPYKLRCCVCRIGRVLWVMEVGRAVGG